MEDDDVILFFNNLLRVQTYSPVIFIALLNGNTAIVKLLIFLQPRVPLRLEFLKVGHDGCRLPQADR